MKKIIISIMSATLLMGAFGANAQEPAKKQYTPEKGDFAIGFDIVPIIRTIGTSIKGKESTTQIGATPFTYEDMRTQPTVSILGKYMLTDKWGVRVNLGVTVDNKNTKAYVKDDLAAAINPMADKRVVDVETITKTGTSLMGGVEYRLGKSRIQGVFGAGLLFAFSTYDAKYQYGNKLTEINHYPSTVINTSSYAGIPNGYRITEARTPGANFTLGGYASAGVECFVAPKMAIGAEVNLALYGVMGYKGIVKSEGFNVDYNKVETFTQQVTPGNTGVHFGTDNLGGSLYMSFYF